MSGADNKNTVFVCGAGRNGTYLIRAILDNHPEIMSLPISFQYHLEWRRTGLTGNEPINEIIRKLFEETDFARLKGNDFIDPHTGRKHDYSNFHWDLFIRSFKAYAAATGTSRRGCMLALYHAAQIAVGNKPDAAALILGDGVYEDMSDDILADFPNARFIYAIRDPRSNVLSLKAYNLIQRGCLVERGAKGFRNRSMVMTILNGMQTNLNAVLRLGQRADASRTLHIVRYEDLTNQPDATVSHLIAWLGIRDHDTLRALTMNGRPFEGDSSFDLTGLDAIRSVATDQWHGRMPLHERVAVEYLLYGGLERYGYRPSCVRKTAAWTLLSVLCCLLPWRGEILYLGRRHHDNKVGFIKRIARRYYYLLLTLPSYFATRALLLADIGRGLYPVR